eukprot:351228-Chlamydomonas_euryale.AAC.2
MHASINKATMQTLAEDNVPGSSLGAIQGRVQSTASAPAADHLDNEKCLWSTPDGLQRMTPGTGDMFACILAKLMRADIVFWFQTKRFSA